MSVRDNYAGSNGVGVSGLPRAIVPADADMTESPKFLFVGTGGNLTVRALGGSDNVVLKNVPSGSFVFVRVSQIRAATTAADIVGIF